MSLHFPKVLKRIRQPVTDGGPFDVPVKFDGSLTASWACRDYPR